MSSSPRGPRRPAGGSELPDLASRLRALPVVALDTPDDALLRAVIVKLFADRQLAVDESLVGFLVNRIERSFAAAREAVARSTGRRCASSARSPGRWPGTCSAKVL